MPSPILARADALMQRRRQNPAENDEVPVLTDSIEDEDIPVLIDSIITSPENLAASAPAIPDNRPPAVATGPDSSLLPRPLAEPQSVRPTFFAEALTPAQREMLVHALAQRVEQRIASELPRLIEAAINDFLAEQTKTSAAQHRE